MTITDPSQLSPNQTIIDFEQFPAPSPQTKVPVNNPLVVGDVTFSTNDALYIWNIIGYGANGTEVESNVLAPYLPHETLTIRFANPVAEVLLGVFDPNFPGNFLRAFDSTDSLLEQVELTDLGEQGGGHATWIGFKRSFAEISRIDVVPAPGDELGIDNIHYHTAVLDEDNDGVSDAEDICPGTVIPEAVPTEHLGVNRFALTNDDTIFDTTPPKGGEPGEVFTLADTAGCSCAQIIEALGLDKGHTKFGCSSGAMREWIEMVHP
jgi:hypothetical protein